MIQSERSADGGVLYLTLDKPKGNVIDAALVAAIEEALEAGVDPGTKAIVFEATGKHFSFGASVEEHQKDQVAGMLARFHGLFRRLADLSIPTCALVQGLCLGGGMELATWCTWIAATPDAKLGQPEIKLAVFPPMASLILPWRAGGAAALDVCLSGRNLTAQEALQLGLITAVVEDPRAWWQIFYDENLAAMSGAALRHAERAARMTLTDALETQLPRLERLYLDELMATHDANEGIAAFLERRKPHFEHR